MAALMRLLLKILLPSFLVSWGIKALGPTLGIPSQPLPALLGVLIPPLAIALWLGWQDWQGRRLR